MPVLAKQWLLAGAIMLLTLTAVYLHKFVESGRNRPGIFGCVDDHGQNAGDYVVKLAGAMDTRERGPSSELIASHLAAHLGLLRPEPAAVMLHPDLIGWLSVQKPDLARILRASSGLNFGTKLLTDGALWPIGRELPDTMLLAAGQIFAFDALIENDDRRQDNQNILVRGDDIFVIDHEAAFSFLYALGRSQSQPWEVRNRPSLLRHLFYYQLRKRPVDLRSFIARLADLGDTELERIVREVPGEWRHSELGRISTHLQCVRDHAGEFQRQVLEALA